MESPSKKKTPLVLIIDRNNLNRPFDEAEAQGNQAYQDLRALFAKHSEEEVIESLQQFYARRASNSHLQEIYLTVSNVLQKISHLIV